MKKENVRILTVLLCIALVVALAYSVSHIYRMRHYIDRSLYQSLSGIDKQLSAIEDDLAELDPDALTTSQMKELIDDFYHGCYHNSMAIKDFKWVSKRYAKYSTFDIGLYSQWLKYEYANHEETLTPSVRKKIYTSLEAICSGRSDWFPDYNPNYDFKRDPRNLAEKIEKINKIAYEYSQEL